MRQLLTKLKLFIRTHRIKYWRERYAELMEAFQIVQSQCEEMEKYQELMLLYQKRNVKLTGEKQVLYSQNEELLQRNRILRENILALRKLVDDKNEKIEQMGKKVKVTESDTLPPEAALSEMNKDPVTAAGGCVIEEENGGDSNGEEVIKTEQK